ncbi:RodZ domain-containing protein [Shewanella japonica]|uniref:RodZ domain-containing protein n=1 Tax=Shewanella japonica TaxID=93973 RepID=UPI0024941485|nr:RodZ domain-containing protein [Shewanella japonica]
MTNNNQTSQKNGSDAEQADILEAVSTAGMLLRTAREKKGLSIDAVATQLHLRPGIIEDIENDKFDNIASATYARGYAKNYAKYIEADVDAVHQCLAQQLPDETAAMQSFSRKTTREARDSRLTIVTYLIVLALLALLVVWWVQKDSMLSGIDLSKPTVEEVAAANVVSQTEDLLEPEIDPNMAYVEPADQLNEQAALQNEQSNNSDLPPSSVQPVEPASTDVVMLDNAQQNVVEPALQSASALVADNVAAQDAISMSFSADCWVNIVDATGKTIVDGVKGVDRVVEAQGVAPFKLILGAPQVVTLQFNGENVSLADFSEGSVARLTLPKV